MINDEVLTRIANPPTPKYRDLNVVSNSLELETYMRFGQKWMAEMAQELLQARQRIRELEEQQRWIPIAEKYPPEIELVDIVVDGIAKRGRWYEDDAYDVEYPSVAPRAPHWEVFDEEEGQLVPLDTPNIPTHWRPLPPPPEEK